MTSFEPFLESCEVGAFDRPLVLAFCVLSTDFELVELLFALLLLDCSFACSAAAAALAAKIQSH